MNTPTAPHISEPGQTILINRNTVRETVIHPAYYNAHPSGVECVEIAQHFSFNTGNAIKYLWRATAKHALPLEDYEKAITYILFEIKRLFPGVQTKITRGHQANTLSAVDALHLFAALITTLPVSIGDKHPSDVAFSILQAFCETYGLGEPSENWPDKTRQVPFDEKLRGYRDPEPVKNLSKALFDECYTGDSSEPSHIPVEYVSEGKDRFDCFERSLTALINFYSIDAVVASEDYRVATQITHYLRQTANTIALAQKEQNVPLDVSTEEVVRGVFRPNGKGGYVFHRIPGGVPVEKLDEHLAASPVENDIIAQQKAAEATNDGPCADPAVEADREAETCDDEAITVKGFGSRGCGCDTTMPAEHKFVKYWRYIATLHNTAMRERGFWKSREDIVAACRALGGAGLADAALAAVDGQAIALMGTEFAEVIEGLRHGNPADTDLPEFTNAEVELADAVLRIMDYSEGRGWRVAEALVKKITVNAVRASMHGKKF